MKNNILTPMIAYALLHRVDSQRLDFYLYKIRPKTNFLGIKSDLSHTPQGMKGFKCFYFILHLFSKIKL